MHTVEKNQTLSVLKVLCNDEEILLPVPWNQYEFHKNISNKIEGGEDTAITSVALDGVL